MDKYLSRSSSTSSLSSKRPADEGPDDWRAPKRYAAHGRHRNLPTQNKFQDLPIDGAINQENKEYQDAVVGIKKTGKIPPIIPDIPKEWTHEIIKNTICKYTNRFHLQYRNAGKVAIICYSSDAHQAVKQGLLNEGAPFLTYTRKDEKSPKVIIRGLPEYVEAELSAELVKLGFKDAVVKKLKTRGGDSTPCPPFLVQLSKGTNITSYTNSRGRVLFQHMLANDYSIHYSSTATQVNYSSRYKPSKPDLVLSKNIVSISDIQAEIALSSNHYPLIFSIDGTVSRLPTTVSYRFKDANWSHYRSKMDEIICLDSTTFNTTSEIDLAVDVLHTTLLAAKEYAVPTAMTSLQPPKLPRCIFNMIKYKIYLRRMDYKLPSGNDKYIRSIINRLCHLIKYNVRIHLDNTWNHELAKVDNPSADLWRITKSLKPKSTVIPALMRPDGTFTNSPSEQCDTLATAFQSNMNLTKDWQSPEVKTRKQILSILTTERIAYSPRGCFSKSISTVPANAYAITSSGEARFEGYFHAILKLVLLPLQHVGDILLQNLEVVTVSHARLEENPDAERKTI
ncbi:unnamed protein product [Leptidea sinapis]|uniref:Reverse transcriptase domain-containing protein n=1 Tax=Leptidea sinapis TaxID=189913 RepID=A0A5E4QBC6_9NEOP|nr:unnamed protein product [Leptidea sinapis]